MTYRTRDDAGDPVDAKSTEANYDRWHDRIDDAIVAEGKSLGEGKTIAELMGDTDGDE